MPGGKIASVFDRFWFEGIFPIIERKDNIKKKGKKGKKLAKGKKWEEVVDDAVEDAGGVSR